MKVLTPHFSSKMSDLAHCALPVGNVKQLWKLISLVSHQGLIIRQHVQKIEFPRKLIFTTVHLWGERYSYQQN